MRQILLCALLLPGGYAFAQVPVTLPDVATTDEEVAVDIPVLANDIDLLGFNAATIDVDMDTDGIQSTLAIADVGTFTVNTSTGIVTFTPVANYNGNATTSYTVENNAAITSLPTLITVTVNPINDAPTAGNDAASTTEDTPVTFSVTSNDTDIDGTINAATVDLDPLTGGRQTSIAATTGSGTFTVDNTGQVTYTPILNFSGTATASYQVNDNSGDVSNTATITVTISSVNDLPVANNDEVTTPEDTPTTVNVISNDTDADGTIDPATVDLDVTAGGIQSTKSDGTGAWSVSTFGVVSFTPVLNFTGAATLPYTVNDNAGGTSNQATITINVSAVNDLPVANNDTGTTPEETATTVNLVTNDTDIDGTINAASVDLDTGTPGIQNANSNSAGSWSVNASGIVTFTPATNFNGNAILTYTVNDNSGGTSNAATITINVTPVNDAPVANGDNASTNEETAVTFNVVVNDTDIDGSIAANTVDLNTTTGGIQNSITNSAGTWSVNATGDVTFTPAVNFSGSATLTYTVNDNAGATSNQATISVTVADQNDAPVANNDMGTTAEETATTVNVVNNDTDIDGTIAVNTVDLNTTAAGIQTTISNASGNWSVSTAGIVSFTPATDFNGTATLLYTVNDNDGATSNEATISINVTPVNDAPVANNDVAATNEDTPVTVTVVTNDTDIDGTINAATVDLNTTTAGIQSTASNAAGTWSVNTSGVVTYTPTANFTGTALLAYRVNDNTGATSNSANISITVNAQNDAPTAVNDAVTTLEDTPVNLNIVNNDTDVDGTIAANTVDLDPATAGIQTSFNVSGGTVSVNASGVITFTPTVNFYGTVTTTYTVNDNSGATSNIATITITVTAVNDAPIANNDLTTADENETVTLNVVTNDLDIDGTVNAATVDLNTTTAGIQTTITVTAGTFTVNATGDVTYTPALNFNGTASITYTVRDNTGATSNQATISILVNSINSLPVASNDAITINEDGVASLNIVANDSDPDGTINAATVDLNTSIAGIQNSITTAQGTFSVNGSGLLSFTPVLNYFGTASITYTVNDNVGATSNQATITITINSVNDAPVANNDTGSASDGVAVTVNVVSNDTDVDGTIDIATVDLDVTTGGIQTSRTTAAGTWTVNTSGIVTFTSIVNYNGVATLTYRVNDNGGATSNNGTISITVSAVNDPPVANNDAATTNEDSPLSINVITNDTDPENNISPSTIDLNTAVSGIQNTITTAAGTFTASTTSPGVVVYTPVLNFNGTATVTYTVNDNGGLTSNEATITITVTPINDAPVAVNDAATTPEDTSVKFDVTANDTDVDGTINDATVDLNTTTGGIQNTNTVAGGTFTVSTAGEVTFTPVADFFGTATVSYRVNDNTGATSNAATITVTVQPVNDPPVFDPIVPDPQRVLRNGAQKTITITGISPGPGETEQLLLSATSGNTTLVPNPTITYNGTATTATLKYQPAPNQSGSADIVVKLVDTGLNEFTQTFTVEIVDVRFTSTPVTVAVEGEPYEYNIEMTDVVDNLTIAAAQKPAWATVTSTGKNKARLSGTPPANAPASSVVRLQIKDGTTVLDEQQYTLVVNHRPVITSYTLSINEDIATPLKAQDFSNAYTDADGNPLTEIQFTALPRHGNLVMNATPLTVNAKVPFSSIATVIYQPMTNYAGYDTIYWKASDGLSYSAASASINYTIAAVNDPPEITFLETDSLDYELGSEEPIIMTAQFNAIDVDTDSLTGAELRFRTENFEAEHDRLLFTPTATITGTYNELTGELLLSGKAPVQEYVQAIRSIQYNYIDLTEIELITKRLSIALNDGESLSTVKDRYIELIYTFEGIDIPNAFTPNGDTRNDVWVITSSKKADSGVEQYKSAEIRIYTKRGKLVFEDIGFQKPWDGMLNGEVLPPDTYYYTIDLKYNKIMYKGIVTILR
ncbi:MAG TPA: tandem-95 repeat protein [Ohtaekwangia sp.]